MKILLVGRRVVPYARIAERADRHEAVLNFAEKPKERPKCRLYSE